MTPAATATFSDSTFGLIGMLIVASISGASPSETPAPLIAEQVDRRGGWGRGGKFVLPLPAALRGSRR